MAMPPPHDKPVDMDVAHPAVSVWRRTLAVLLTTVAFAGTAFAVASLVSPVYKAETQIVIGDGESFDTRSDDLGAAGVESQVSLMTSAEVLGDVAARLQLASLPEFASAGGGVLDVLAPKSATGDVVEAMREKLKVFGKAGTRVVVIEFSSHDPQLARDVPNAIATEYLARRKEAELSSNPGATEWLERDRRLDSVADALASPTAGALRERQAALTAEIADLSAMLLDGQPRSELLESGFTPGREVVTPGAGDALPVDARVLSEAKLPGEPHVPNVLAVTAAASLAGFLLACLGIALRPAVSAGRARADVSPVAANADGRDELRNGAHGDGLTTVDELAEAVLASGIRRTFVVSAGDLDGEPGSAGLARSLAARSATVILVDLADARRGAGAMGIAAGASGIAELLTGTAGFTEVIHRDRSSAANVLSGGAPAMSVGCKDGHRAGLTEIFEALAEAYDCTIVECGTMTEDRLLAMMDERSAVVVAMPAGAEETAMAVLRRLEAAGQMDALVMQLGERPHENERLSAAA